jgi:hypothetical protein
MIVRLIFKRESSGGNPDFLLIHVKIMDETGKHLAFAQHMQSVLDFIAGLEFDVPDDLLTWKGKDHAREYHVGV